MVQCQKSGANGMLNNHIINNMSITRCRKFLHCILAAICFLLASTASSTELIILTENLPPLNYIKDGNLVGPAVEMVQEIQKRVGSHELIQVYPWARAYMMALDMENVVLFGITHTKERKDKFKWIGPIGKKRDVFFAKKGASFKIKNLEDAKKVDRIGTLRNDAKEEFLIHHGFTNLVSTFDERKNAQKLLLGRIDLWVYKNPGIETICELAEVDHTQFEEVLNLKEFEIYIGFSLKSHDLIYNKWNNAFEEMIKDGTYKKIQEKWGFQ